MQGWQREGESSREGGRIGLVRGGRSGRRVIVGGGLGGISPLPLALIAGAKKLLQDVSGDVLDGIPAPAFSHDTNVLAGRVLPHDCATTNERPDGNSNGAHDVSRRSLSLMAPAITGKCRIIKR
jgi:hypothetical protein